MIVLRNTPTALAAKISDHFYGSEFRCKCRRCRLTLISEQLLLRCEILRVMWGKPLTPTSAYRCQEYNQSLENSAEYSWHMCGCAVDWPLYMQADQQLQFINLVDKIFPYHYVGKGFVHADTRGI